MAIRVLYAGPHAGWADYAPAIARACAAAGLEIALVAEAPDPTAIDYIVVAPDGPIRDFRPFTRARAVLSLWAGVEAIAGNATLTQPLARMVDDGLRAGMVEWVTGHVLRHHLGIDAVLAGQDGIWRNTPPPVARDRRVGILGLGALGMACATALAGLGFDVAGWSRTGKTSCPVTCHTGEDGLERLLGRSDILVALLPLTAATENLLDAARLGLLPRGAVLLNPGRGALVDEQALIAALDGGQLAHATLDVFRTEPLPPAHPFWSHPRVTVSCHIAAATRPASAAKVIAENIRRGEAGAPLLYLVDRDRGY